MDAGDSETKCFWKPRTNQTTNFDDYRDQINNKFGLNLVSYQDVYNWSVENYSQFWEELWWFSDIKHSQPYQQVIDPNLGIAAIPKWFQGSRLNFAENLLRGVDEKVAVYTAVEGCEEVRKSTYAEVRANVSKLAASMKQMGVKSGDRVVGYLPNCTEAVEIMLAATSIGAIWSSTSPEFGVTGVLDRFTQISPKLMFSVNAVVYNGKIHDHMEKLEAVVQGLTELEHVVVIQYVENSPCDLNHIEHGSLYAHFLSSGLLADGSTHPLTFEQLPFDHPVYIMYSSGTTGVPKCLVHSAGGTLLKHFEEHLLQGNMKKDDIMLYYTTTGWMMWNWFVSCLAVGASIVCYDGSPLIPSANVLWDLVDSIGITVLGTGAKWLSVLEEKGVRPKETHSLTTLHSILSTGSPLKPQSYDYVYRDIKSDLILGSITGGTDIIGCFAGQSWNVPVYRGEIQCRFLGMAVESWDEDGHPVSGSSGELVCTKPFPSMPVFFWKDPEGDKYRRAYFEKFAGVWAHGDFCVISKETGGIWMLGRSDGTLNPNGVRFGSAEIYHVVEAFDEIQDVLCVAQRNNSATEERVVLFLKMAPGETFTEDLVKKVRLSIRTKLSARHLPAIVLQTQDIPYTNSGKKVEVAVRRIIAGEEVKVRGAYSNPDSLDLYKDIPELQGY